MVVHKRRCFTGAKIVRAPLPLHPTCNFGTMRPSRTHFVPRSGHGRPPCPGLLAHAVRLGPGLGRGPGRPCSTSRRARRFGGGAIGPGTVDHGCFLSPRPVTRACPQRVGPPLPTAWRSRARRSGLGDAKTAMRVADSCAHPRSAERGAWTFKFRSALLDRYGRPIFLQGR